MQLKDQQSADRLVRIREVNGQIRVTFCIVYANSVSCFESASRETIF